MDWGSLAGLAIALAGILFGQWIEGGRLDSLLQPAAFLIVMLGTVGAVLLQSGLHTFVAGLRMARQAFVRHEHDHQRVLREMSKWSMAARREGLLSLEKFIAETPDPFLQKGLRLIVDGVDPIKLRELLESELDAWERQQRLAARVWESAGGYAPTVGILGAVLGLIHVMENLSDPSRLGSGIAVAFVATIYGVGLANLVFLPIGTKLRNQVIEEAARRDMLISALIGIASGDNPRLMEERIAAPAA